MLYNKTVFNSNETENGEKKEKMKREKKCEKWMRCLFNYIINNKYLSIDAPFSGLLNWIGQPKRKKKCLSSAVDVNCVEKGRKPKKTEGDKMNKWKVFLGFFWIQSDKTKVNKQEKEIQLVNSGKEIFEILQK